MRKGKSSKKLCYYRKKILLQNDFALPCIGKQDEQKSFRVYNLLVRATFDGQV